MHPIKTKSVKNVKLNPVFGEYQPNVWEALFQKGSETSSVLKMIENSHCNYDEKDTSEIMFNYIPLLELAGLRNIFPKKKGAVDSDTTPTFTKNQIIDIFLKYPQFINEDYVHIFPNLNKNQELQFFCIFCKKGIWDFKIANNNTVESYFKENANDLPTFFEPKQ